jgi:branched-subunit amino acid transport protein
VSLLTVLLLAAVVTYVLRVTLVTIVPAGQLPAIVREGLEHVSPATLAALVAVALVGGTHGGPALPVWLAAGFTAVVAWRTHNLLVTTGAGVGMLALLTLALA